ncbi:type I-E CRISPR-associated protein Cse1/CasA [Embleya hyalina]|uniref:Type I-E CRISPR-associated protein Cse1/CasA n=1 Tax=Embleya hyalina TaxID=516124 RepID=A0A401YYJ4_9ACTN|nr:type I-E CRISPR-associated protein Cse1/CasA [Embleya hyalina]GCD99704.1 type I-E CRISPR-associated protein Cse1/CasA [Embleya hyalina]
MPAFSLVDDPWLTLAPRGGGPPELHPGRHALIHADEFETLVVDLPTQAPALLRQFLLPIVRAALGPPGGRAGWLERFRAGAFDKDEKERLNAYLDTHRDRFDLFHPTHPFAQVAGLRTAKDETKGSALLVATAATGNNVPLFASRTEGDPLPLTPAEAAHWLLHTHCWDTAAIKTGAADDDQAKAGKTTGNPTGPLGQLGVVVPTGRTLYETLLLNTPYRTGAIPGDKPQWEQPPAGHTWKTRAAHGLSDLWTWQSRRIRLVPEETHDGTVRVTRVIITAGDRLKETPDFEPHTAWSIPPTGRKSPQTPMRRPRRHQPGKAAWRGLDALLEADVRTSTGPGKSSAGFETSVLVDQLRDLGDALPTDHPVQLEMTGISYGTQSAVVDDVLFDAIPLPLTALAADSPARDALLEAAEQAEELARAINHLSADLRRAAGADPIPWDKGQRPGELLLHALDPLMRRLLAGLRSAADDADLVERGLLAWEQLALRHAHDIADRVVTAAAPGVFAGRTVDDNGRERTYRLATADDNFRFQLRRTLTRATETARRDTAANTHDEDEDDDT